MCPAARIRRTSRPRNGLPGSRASSTWDMKSCASKSLKIRRSSASFRRIPNLLHGRTGRMRMVGRSCPGGIHFPLCKKSFMRVRPKSLPPMRLTPTMKSVASHFGGTRQGMAISWPGHITDLGGIRTQFHHMIDIVPTLLEATGIKAPELVNGIKQKPIEGVSMVYTFDKANADARSKHKTQYFEMVGNRAIYHDGWVAATTPPVAPWLLGAKMPELGDYHWELYNVAKDFSENNDLAAQQPDKLKE